MKKPTKAKLYEHVALITEIHKYPCSKIVDLVLKDGTEWRYRFKTLQDMIIFCEDLVDEIIKET